MKYLPGTEIKFEWDAFEYLASKTLCGIVAEYADTLYDKTQKQLGLIKVYVPKKIKGHYDIHWIAENDTSIRVITQWTKIKDWLKKYL